jgi:dTDP-6-deoxy-L-talose 4-dehydrogenase (NAD+)
MKILVTGANGYMGTGIIKQLLDDGIDVVAADFITDKVDERAELMETDLFEIGNPYDYFGKPDVLLHLAWRDGFKHDSFNHIGDLPKHYAFISSMIQSGISRVCVLGTMHEVGFYEGSIDENTPTAPQSLYGISKNALRDAVRLEADKYGAIFQWIRGYYIVGNTTAGCSIFSKITEAEKAGKTEFPFTMGINQYDFIDYDDFCLQVASVVEQRDINGIINCCSGYPVRLGERVEQFIKDNHYHIKLKYGAFPDRPYDSKAVWGNNHKITKILEERNLT